MKLTFLKGVALGSVIAMATLTATSAMAGTGIGGVFNLGKTNKVNASSGLKGIASGPMLAVTNNGNGPGLSLRVGPGKPPFTVNSRTQVANLNASLLGGLAPASFVHGDTHAFALTIPAGQLGGEPLLSIPGYGSLRAECAMGFGSVNYRNGARAADLWHFAADSHVFGTGLLSVPASADRLVLSVPSGNAGWLSLIIESASRAGFLLLRHVATVEVGVNFDGSTCKFAAEELAGAGQVLP